MLSCCKGAALVVPASISALANAAAGPTHTLHSVLCWRLQTTALRLEDHTRTPLKLLGGEHSAQWGQGCFICCSLQAQRQILRQQAAQSCSRAAGVASMARSVGRAASCGARAHREAATPSDRDVTCPAAPSAAGAAAPAGAAAAEASSACCSSWHDSASCTHTACRSALT